MRTLSYIAIMKGFLREGTNSILMVMCPCPTGVNNMMILTFAYTPQGQDFHFPIDFSADGLGNPSQFGGSGVAISTIITWYFSVPMYSVLPITYYLYSKNVIVDPAQSVYILCP
ncbi:hypothetical protein BJX61DRAFT_528023 [Aspergillus egyptiacus]|nr:hypothetical protein BJX61DRAFT_528023 [Aspergillus egyptiacus]